VKRWILLLTVVVAGASLVVGQQTPTQERPATTAAADTGALRFTHVDVYVDTKGADLAAYQLEFAVEKGKAIVTGIGAGEHSAFAKLPPYYDPAAMQHDRVILASFSTDEALPKGRTRVAQIMLMVEGSETPQYTAKLVVAADAAGKAIPGASVSISEGVRP
jgi:hypothetical protein